MSLSPETRERLVEAMAKAIHEATNGPGSWPTLTPSGRRAFRKGILATRNSARAALAVVLDDPQVTITERTAVPPHHHEYVGGRCYRCGLASPTQWIDALDGRPVNPENETSNE